MRSSLLERSASFSSNQDPALTRSQVQLDATVATLADEARNPLGIAAMVAGSFAYRASNLVFARLASPLLAESGLVARSLAQTAIRGASLGTEVTAFRAASNAFGSLAGHASAQGVFDADGWRGTFIDFLALKTIGHAAGGTNLALTHFAQANAMVLGHELSAGLGLSARQEGSYIERLAQAEATNIKMGLGMSLLGVAAPGLSRLERRMEAENAALNAGRSASLPSLDATSPILSFGAQEGNGSGEANGSMETNGFAPNRYHLPKTPFFDDLGPSLSLRQLAGYARSRRDVSTGGFNFETGLITPLRGPTEYSPYGADLVEGARENPLRGLELYTGKWERATVVSPATAILGLGNARIDADFTLEAAAAQIIMTGKGKFLKWASGVNTFPLCFTYRFTPTELSMLRGLPEAEAKERARILRAERFSQWVDGLADNFGFINVEDSAGNDVSGILQRLAWLKGRSAVWSDDVQGTGVIAAAGVRSWILHSGNKVPGRNWGNIRGIIFGAGAGSMGVYHELLNNGAQHGNILVKDSRRVLTEGDPAFQSDPYKVAMSAGIPPGTTMDSFMADGIDFVINLGDPRVFTKDAAWTENFFRRMNPHPLAAFLTNPEPGIRPAQLKRVRPDASYASGNQTLPSPFNNFVAFTHIGGGSLIARAGGIGDLMTREASRAISEVAQLGPEAHRRDRLPADQRDFGQFYLVPHALDTRLIPAEMGAVAKAAAREGLVNRNALLSIGIFLSETPTEAEIARFDAYVDEQTAIRVAEVEYYRELVAREAPRRLQISFGKRYAPFRLPNAEDNEWDVAPRVDSSEFEKYARHMGIKEERWEHFTTERGEMKPDALSLALNHLKENAEGTSEQAWVARQELEIITLISHICPALGMALAVRRGRIHPDNLAERPTVFHRENVLDLVREIVPEAVEEITRTFPTVPRPE